MADIPHFSLTQLKQLLDGNSAMQTNNYISQNLAIARHVHPQVIMSQFRQGAVRMSEMRILIVKQGWAAPIINLTPQRFEAGELVFVGPESIVQIDAFSPQVEGMGLSMTNDLFALALGSGPGPKAFDGHLRDFHFSLLPSELQFLDHIHHLLYLHTHEKSHSPQVTLHLLSSFLWYVDLLWSRQEAQERQTQSRQQQLYSDFMQLVGRHARQQHGIAFYASHLCLSARYMSTLVKQASGKAAKQWIDEALLTNIKIELRHSSKSVAQISDEMQFPNPSFFCKFFKRMTGMSPQQYRTGGGGGGDDRCDSRS